MADTAGRSVVLKGLRGVTLHPPTTVARVSHQSRCLGKNTSEFESQDVRRSDMVFISLDQTFAAVLPPSARPPSRRARREGQQEEVQWRNGFMSDECYFHSVF